MSMTPAVRFKGFTDPWEQRKLNEHLAVSEEKNLDGMYGREDVLSVSRDFGVVNQIEFQGRSYAGASVLNYGVLPHGGVVYTKSPLSANPFGIIKSNKGSSGIVSTLYAVYLARENTDPDFVDCYFQQDDRLNRYLHPLVNKGAKNDMKVSAENALLGLVCFPGRQEQQNIAELFRRLDNLITLHQRKYDQLAVLKKALLDKMFPRDGAFVPEIRFVGFTDPWEQRKFSDFVVASGIKNRDNLPLQSYSVSNDRGFVPQDEQFENGGTMRDADKSMYWIVEPGSFAYNPARINVGSIGYLSTSENVIVSSLYEVFRADESCDDRFLWHWFKSPLFMKQIEMLQEGGVRLYFFFDKLLLSEIWMPSVEEQRLIGAHFDRLDNLITLHQRKLGLLKNLKAALLDKMFV